MDFNFTVTEQEANVILQALQELPAKLANPLTKKLMEQGQSQIPKQEQETSASE